MTLTPTVLVVAGTRPEWQKLATVIPALRAKGVSVEFVWTGQHTDVGMTSGFAEGLGWPEPDARVAWSPGGESALIEWWRSEHRDAQPAMVLVQGDTASTVLGAELKQRHFRRALLCHLEAGLRSWDSIPEERNRRAVDRVADLLLCPSKLAVAHAQVDRKPGAAVFATGQTGLDALHAARDRALPYAGSDPWILLTIHRAAMDDLESLERVLVGAERARCALGCSRVVWPMHPRVAKSSHATPQLVSWAAAGGIDVVPPMSYRQMVGRLTAPGRPVAVISDSGGLVEETCYLGIPTAIVRPSTERWELVARGDAVLVRPENAEDYLASELSALVQRGPGARSGRDRGRASPYGTPTAYHADTPTGRAVAAIRYALGPAIGA